MPTEVQMVESSGGVDPGEYELEVQDREVIWLDTSDWSEIDGPNDPELEGDARAKYQVSFQVAGTEGFTLNAQWWLKVSNGSLQVGSGSGLGELLERFGIWDTDSSMDLNSVFEPGNRFKADVIDEPDGDYLAIDDVSIAGHDDDDFDDEGSWGETLTPVEDVDAEVGGKDSQDLEARVIEVVAEHEGKEKNDIMRILAQEDGNLVAAYNDMIEDGEIQVDEHDIVTL